MRIRSFLVCVALLFASSAFAEPPVFKDMLLVVLAGQSNMAGRGIIAPEDKIPIPNVYKLDKDGNWAPSIEPTHYDKTTAGVCLGRTFARLLHEKYPERIIGIVPCAVGGSAIEHWTPGAKFKIKKDTTVNPYDDALERIRRAQKDGKIVALLWHQGCSNALKQREYDVAKEDYRKKLVELIARFRTDIPELGNVPFIMGHLLSFRPEMKIEHVNQAIDEVAKSVPNTATVSAEGMKPKKDNLHYDRASLMIFGERYFRAYEGMK